MCLGRDGIDRHLLRGQWIVFRGLDLSFVVFSHTRSLFLVRGRLGSPSFVIGPAKKVSACALKEIGRIVRKKKSIHFIPPDALSIGEKACKSINSCFFFYGGWRM